MYWYKKNQLDQGKSSETTQYNEIIHDWKPVKDRLLLNGYGNKFNRAIGYSYLEVTKSLLEPGNFLINTFNPPKTPVKVIYPIEVYTISNNTYMRHTTHSDIIYGNVYLKLKFHREINKTVVQTTYEYELAYTLYLLIVTD